MSCFAISRRSRAAPWLPRLAMRPGFTIAAASRAADRSELRPLAWIFTVLVMLINVPIAFRGGLYSWVLILIAVGILWLPVYTDVLDD